MNLDEIMQELESQGKESIKKVLLNHGIQEPFFGVKIEDLKKIQKRIKTNYQLSLDLYNTGNYDARYLAGLIADDMAMTRHDLQLWVEAANCSTLSENTVPWVAAGGTFGVEMAAKWIESSKENIASSGWATYSSLVSLMNDADLDLPLLERLLLRVENTIHDQSNRVRSTMNGFVISVGTYVAPLTDLAVQTAMKIGKVSVNVGATACKVAFAPEYIQKATVRGDIGKKRKTVKC